MPEFVWRVFRVSLDTVGWLLRPQGISLSICAQRVIPASTRTPPFLGRVKHAEHAQYVLRTRTRAWELQIVYHVSIVSGMRIVLHANAWMDTRVVVT